MNFICLLVLFDWLILNLDLENFYKEIWDIFCLIMIKLIKNMNMYDNILKLFFFKEFNVLLVNDYK